MKKHLIVMLAILAVVCALLALTACGEHRHEYGEWIEAKDASCAHVGNVGHYHCQKCGKNFDKNYNELETVSIPKLNHTWDDGVVTPATCEQNGETLYTCVVCKDTKSVTIAATGHDWNVGEIVLAPTCSLPGFRELTCLNCNQTRTVEMAMLSHTPQLIPAVAPTCESAGNTAGEKCSVCGLIIESDKYIAPLGHSFGEWETLIAATDDHAGLEIRTCTVCNNKSETRDIEQKEHVWGEWQYNYDNGTHTRKCQNKDCENNVDTQSCVYNQGEVALPTCTRGGFTTYTCQLCKHAISGEPTEALGHNYGSFTADYVGVENFENHTHTHTRTCKRCGDLDTEACSDTTQAVIEPSCTTGGYTTSTCNTCGSVHETKRTEALGHSFGQWTYDASAADVHTQTCGTCGAVEKQACLYDGVVTLPTCTDNGYTTHTCSVCAHAYVDAQTDAYGHSYGDWSYDGGQSRTHTHVCSRCENAETKPCEMVTVTQAETCTTDGSVTETCKHCLISFTSEGAKLLGHDFSEFADDGSGNHVRVCNRCGADEKEPHVYDTTTISEADCLNARVVKSTCTVCNSSYNESVGEALGHFWPDWTAKADKHVRTCLRNGDHVEEFAHAFTTTNLCEACNYDCLIYKLQGGHYVVYGDDKLPASVTTVIIGDKHGEVGQDNLYDVTQIYENAFMGNRNITSVSLPATLTTVSDYAFYGCTALTTVTVAAQSQLTEIGYCAFVNCTALVSFVLPDGLVSIGGFAFSNCVKLFEIDVPASVQSLGSNAFRNTACYNDTNRWTDNVLYLGKHLIAARADVSDEYTVKDGTISIGYMAFSECKELTAINLPASLKYVESNAFLGCEALTSVGFGGTMDDWFEITFVNDASSPLYYAARLNIEQASGEIAIPDGVTSIPAGTFRGTAITSVRIPDSVTFIGEEAFENCSELTFINVPDSVKYVGANAFTGSGYYNDDANWTDGVLYVGNHLIATRSDIVSGQYTVRVGTVTIGIEAFKNCASLTQVTIAETVVRIGAKAFEGCTSLTSVVFQDTSNKWLANRINTLSRMLDNDDLSSPTKVPQLFEYYNGEWKRWN